jgi:hypothetical protein
MEPFFSIVIPNHKADKDLGANTNASWRTIHRKRQTDKKLVAAILMNSLTGSSSLPTWANIRLRNACRFT